MISCPSCLSKKTEFAFNKKDFKFRKCLSCNLIFCSNIPRENELQEYYLKDDFCSKERAKFIVNLENRYFLGKFRKYLGKKKEQKKILDFGCGRGVLMELLKAQGHHVEGVDFSKDNINADRKKGLDVTRAMKKDAKNKYDVVIMKYVLEHLTRPLKTMKTIRNSMKNKGIIIIDIPNIDGKDFKKLGKEWLIIDPPYHLLFFNKNSIRVFLEKEGFEIISIEDSKIPSYLFPFNTPFPINVPFKAARLMIPRALLKGQGSNLQIVAEKK